MMLLRDVCVMYMMLLHDVCIMLLRDFYVMLLCDVID